jgi:hypothetical protein
MQEMDKRSKKSTNISNAVKDIWIKRKNGIALNNDGIPLELQKDSKRKPKKKRAILMRPENVNEVVNYFIENGYSKNAATRAFNYYEVNDWHDKNGEPVLNWKMKMQSVWFKDENKDTTEKPIEQMSIEEIREMKNKQFRL